MSLTLTEWDISIGRHLHFISAGADIIARHVAEIKGRPDFGTLAQDDLGELETMLEQALAVVRKARADYDRKPPFD